MVRLPRLVAMGLIRYQFLVSPLLGGTAASFRVAPSTPWRRSIVTDSSVAVGCAKTIGPVPPFPTRGVRPGTHLER